MRDTIITLVKEVYSKKFLNILEKRILIVYNVIDEN